MFLEHRGERPKVHDGAYVAPDATLCGDVTVGENTRVMFGAVLTAEGGLVMLQRALFAFTDTSLAPYGCEICLLGCVEEVVQGVGGMLGSLFREEVAGAQGVSSNVVAPGSTERDRPPSSMYQVSSGPPALHSARRGHRLGGGGGQKVREHRAPGDI